MKTVLGLVISARRLGNSELLVKEIMDSVPEPCSRQLIRLTELRIEPCQACYRCLQPGSSCKINDDFNFLISKIMECDALVIGLPVYFLGPHASYKMLADRLLGAGHYAEHTRGKPCVLVIPYGIPGWEGYARVAAVTLPGLLQMRVVDIWQVHAALPGEALLMPENQARARSLGSKLFSGQLYSPARWECPRCGGDLFRLLEGGGIQCPACGAQGTWQTDGEVGFASEGYYRFSREQMEEHFGSWLVEMKDKFRREKERLKRVQEAYRDQNWWVGR